MPYLGVSRCINAAFACLAQTKLLKTSFQDTHTHKITVSKANESVKKNQYKDKLTCCPFGSRPNALVHVDDAISLDTDVH